MLKCVINVKQQVFYINESKKICYKISIINLRTLLVQSNLNGSNTDGLFTMAYSNSFLSPYEILPIAQENKYLEKFSYFIINLYVEYTHWNCLYEAILMSTHNIQLLCRELKTFS